MMTVPQVLSRRGMLAREDRIVAGEDWPHGPRASTLKVVSGFAPIDFLVEVEAVAAA